MTIPSTIPEAVDILAARVKTLETGGGGGALTGDVLPATCQGRLTLESGAAISTTDQTAKTTLYFTPYKGNVIALYDGSSTWTAYAFSEISLSLSGYTANTNYDIWAYESGGAPVLESTAWTDATTRATALTTQNGVYVKSGATTRRYLGTIRITASTGQCEDSDLKRLVWNAQNQEPRRLRRHDDANSWTYNSTTVRSWNNSTANRVEFVIGLPTALVNLTFVALSNNSLGGSHSIGIGLDSTTTNSAAIHLGLASDRAVHSIAFYKAYPGIGSHYLQLLEVGGSVGTTTFYGDANSTTYYQGGAVGEVLG